MGDRGRASNCWILCVCTPPAGVPMVPVSWQEMQCPQTKAVENRKVAKLDA